LIDRKVFPPLPILIGAHFLGAVAVFNIAYAGLSFWSIMVTIFLSGFFIIGVQLSLNAFITGFYPTSIRGTGVGWSQVVGRSGSLIGPLVCGVLVSQGVSAAALFRVSAIAPLLARGSLLLFTLLWSQGGEHADSPDAMPDGDQERVATS
jgi:AAHS family 4-hydroxybenzoate transporter-like MFS transporter